MVDQAVAAQREGQRAMAAMSNAKRSDLLFRLHAMLTREVAEIGRLICMESGKRSKRRASRPNRGLHHGSPLFLYCIRAPIHAGDNFVYRQCLDGRDTRQFLNEGLIHLCVGASQQ